MIAISASGVLPKTLETSVIGCLSKGGSIEKIVGTIRRATDSHPRKIVRSG
jgi:hypothetical protein